MEQQPESIPPIQQSLHERLTLSDDDKVRVPRTGNRAMSCIAAVVLYTLPAVVVVLLAMECADSLWLRNRVGWVFIFFVHGAVFAALLVVAVRQALQHSRWQALLMGVYLAVIYIPLTLFSTGVVMSAMMQF